MSGGHLLECYREHPVLVITTDGRAIVGSLSGYDQATNIILSDAHERVFSEFEGVEKVHLGLYLIRGDSVVMVGEFDESLDARIDWTQMSIFRVRSSGLSQFINTLQGRALTTRNPNDAERQKFESSQSSSVQKILTSSECEPKEKHVRNIILGTFHEEGSYLFWTLMIGVQLENNPIICWKFCYLFHRILRDGHKNVITDSVPVVSYMEELGKFWSSLPQHYGIMIQRYCNLIAVKLKFHQQHTFFPGNLQMTFDSFKATINSSTDACFDISASLLDYLDSLLDFQAVVFKAIDQYYANSMTLIGQCRLRPLVPCIHEANTLYDLIVKTLFEMHNVLQASDLEGHRIRFNKSFNRLKDFLRRAKNIQFFQSIITIPDMPRFAPDFNLREDLESYETPICTITNDHPSSASLEEPELILDLNDEEIDETNSDSRSVSSLNTYVAMEPKYSTIQQHSTTILTPEEPIYAAVSNRVLPDQFKSIETTVSGNSSVQTVIKQLSVMKETNAQKDELISALRLKVLELAQDKQKNCRQVEKVSDCLKAKEDKYEKLKQSYSKLREQHILILKSESNLRKELTGFKQRQQSFSSNQSNELLCETESNEQLVKQMDDQMKGMDTLKATLTQNDEDLNKLRVQNEKLNAKVDELVRQCEQAYDELSELKKVHNEKVSRTEAQSKKIIDLESENNVLSNKLNELIEQNKSLETLSSNNQQLLERIRKFEDERETLISDKTKIESNVDQLKKTMDATTSKFQLEKETLRMETHNVRLDLTKQEEILKRVEEEKRELSQVLLHTKLENEQMCKELEAKRNISDGIESAKKELEADILDMLHDKEKVESDLKEIQDKLIESEALTNSLAEAALKAEHDAEQLFTAKYKALADSCSDQCENLLLLDMSTSRNLDLLRTSYAVLLASDVKERCLACLRLFWACRELNLKDETAELRFKVSEILVCSKFENKAKLEHYCLQLWRIIGSCIKDNMDFSFQFDDKQCENIESSIRKFNEYARSDLHGTIQNNFCSDIDTFLNKLDFGKATETCLKLYASLPDDPNIDQYMQEIVRTLVQGTH